MALKATIFKANLQIADLDRHHYSEYALTIARHPSETDERMMVRLLAFALRADASLSFGKGVSEVDEPDVWSKDLTGAIQLWIDVGQPDERRILKACGRAAEVLVIAYGSNADIWWRGIEARLARGRNLRVIKLPHFAAASLSQLVERSMQLQCTIQDGQIWLSNGQITQHIEPELLRDRAED